MGHKRPKIMFHSLKLLSQLRHPEPRRGEGSHFDEILRSGFPWKIPFQRKPESSLLGRPFGPQNDKINFMSPTAPIDGIMLSKLDTHERGAYFVMEQTQSDSYLRIPGARLLAARDINPNAPEFSMPRNTGIWLVESPLFMVRKGIGHFIDNPTESGNLADTSVFNAPTADRTPYDKSRLLSVTNRLHALTPLGALVAATEKVFMDVILCRNQKQYSSIHAQLHARGSANSIRGNIYKELEFIRTEVEPGRTSVDMAELQKFLIEQGDALMQASNYR